MFSFISLFHFLFFCYFIPCIIPYNEMPHFLFLFFVLNSILYSYEHSTLVPYISFTLYEDIFALKFIVVCIIIKSVLK